MKGGTPTSDAPALIVVAASAGGFQPMLDIVKALPLDLNASIVVVLHRSPERPFELDKVVRRLTSWPVEWVTPELSIRPGTIYIVPHDLHAQVTADRRFVLTDGHRIRGVRSSANPLLETAAEVYRDRLAAVVLSGGDSDATDGVQSVHRGGGRVIVQNPLTSTVAGMPTHAIATGDVDAVLDAPLIPTESVAFDPCSQADPRILNRRPS
jgi:two-component system chemotaxis response regulator CheB